MCINIPLTLFFKTTTRRKHFHCVRDIVDAGKGSVADAEESVSAGRPFTCSGHGNPGLRERIAELEGRALTLRDALGSGAGPQLGPQGSESSLIFPDCNPHPTFASGRRSRTSFRSVPRSPGVEVPALSRSSSLTFQAANKN